MQPVLPSNPTPPITPNTVTSMPPAYPKPNGQVPCAPMPNCGSDVKPNMADLKPNVGGRRDGELRLAFEIRDGVVLPPFRLEHNNAVNSQYFHLRDNLFQTLNYRCVRRNSALVQVSLLGRIHVCNSCLLLQT